MESTKETKKITNFIFKMGQLKRVKRSGWWTAGVKDPESVAEHCFRAAVLGIILGRMENADENNVMKMCLFNDMHETRLNDLHKLGQRYIPFKKYEKEVFNEQINSLPNQFHNIFNGIIEDLQNDTTKEGMVARDADLLECAYQAKEYLDLGFKETQDWLNNIKKALRTNSAKDLFADLIKTDSYSWWHGLKNAKR